METRFKGKKDPLKASSRIPIRNSIATKLLRIVFGFYLVIAIGVTVGHMVMEYRYQKESISRDLEDIQRTFERGLAIDIWQLSEESLLTAVDGMLEIPVIVGVKIQDINGVDALDCSRHLRAIAKWKCQNQAQLVSTCYAPLFLKMHVNWTLNSEQALLNYGNWKTTFIRQPLGKPTYYPDSPVREAPLHLLGHYDHNSGGKGSCVGLERSYEHHF